jgi:uncharacterized membrane protein required for colicin V production
MVNKKGFVGEILGIVAGFVMGFIFGRFFYDNVINLVKGWLKI